MTSKTKEILRLKNIYKHYAQGGENIQALQNINLSVSSGEIVAIVGESGSGKTSLLQIAGLLSPADSGRVIINGTEINSNKLSNKKATLLRRNFIGFIYQFHHLLADFTAIENVMIPQLIAGKNKDAAREKAATLLEAVKLSHRSDHIPSAMSGGEQQRVAIARALANSPTLIIADEPTGNLDPKTSEEVFQLLLKIVKTNNIAAVIATHNISLAERMDRIISLD